MTHTTATTSTVAPWKGDAHRGDSTKATISVRKKSATKTPDLNAAAVGTRRIICGHLYCRK
ncbi:hypothetical protein NECAME_01730 [Necator americanus]|uniref:Uncharacterized protein n=1 Tax=Necator americanus TaxID=51031 RepID=W2TSE6_NECAM|nr:hypothetical protein NECAME_01730 [Necator americanus]ETN83937.1 hypothetical protein NECAME_01730 [Necator americanus]